MDLAALAAKASQLNPQGLAQQGAVKGRLLLVDGDAICYACAGSEDTSPSQAKQNVRDALEGAKSAAGASEILVLMTDPCSPKGGRYAVATRKPYQGQRSGSRRPKNWEYLRQTLSADTFDGVPIRFGGELEADDLFAMYSKDVGAENVVHYTQDKDMRMVPGWHLDWHTKAMMYLAPGMWHVRYNDKVFGRAWFWYQMLHGDTADNIPGLPFYKDGSVYASGLKKGQEKEIRVGPKAECLDALSEISTDKAAFEYVMALYKTCYPENPGLEMLEQGILLWIRPEQDIWSVAKQGNPLFYLRAGSRWDEHVETINARLQEYRNARPTEDY